MGPIARAVSDDDVRQAAEYFAALKPTVWVKNLFRGRHHVSI